MSLFELDVYAGPTPALATVGLVNTEKGWELEQVQGKCNSDPGLKLVELGSLILNRQKLAVKNKRLQALNAQTQILRHLETADSIGKQIRNRCCELMDDLERLRAVTVAGFDMSIAIEQIANVLREFLNLRKDAFDEELIQRIRLLLDWRPSSEFTIHPEHETFVVGNCYLAGSNPFRVLESEPALKIQQESAVASFSNDLVPGLWTQHAKSLNALIEKLEFYQTTPLSAEIEIDKVLLRAEDQLQHAHEEPLNHPGLPVTDNCRSFKRRRVTHCYSCKHPLDNDIDLECKSCGWMVCNCGACGCGWG